MAGSNIFIMYADGHGNVTVSPRLCTGHVEPKHDTVTRIEVLEGSGIRDGLMVANVRCANCHSWPGGSMDFTRRDGEWIYASLPGEPLDSTDLDEQIGYHEEQGVFIWDINAAAGGLDVNPFLSRNSRTEPTPIPTSSSTTTTTDDAAADLEARINVMSIAHGILASVVFLALLPGGAIFIRIPQLTRFIWVHATIQIFAYCTFGAAAGLGIYLAKNEHLLTNHHSIIGMILLGLLVFQPYTGLLHHRLYKKKQRRTMVSHGHIWVGRAAMILGMINGGLGLQIADVTNMGYLAAYAIVAGVMGAAYLAVAVYGEWKRYRSPHLPVQRDDGKESSGELVAARGQ